MREHKKDVRSLLRREKFSQDNNNGEMLTSMSWKNINFAAFVPLSHPINIVD